MSVKELLEATEVNIRQAEYQVSMKTAKVFLGAAKERISQALALLAKPEPNGIELCKQCRSWVGGECTTDVPCDMDFSAFIPKPEPIIETDLTITDWRNLAEQRQQTVCRRKNHQRCHLSR